jgi:hypothetical protein
MRSSDLRTLPMLRAVLERLSSSLSPPPEEAGGGGGITALEEEDADGRGMGSGRADSLVDGDPKLTSSTLLPFLMSKNFLLAVGEGGGSSILDAGGSMLVWL